MLARNKIMKTKYVVQFSAGKDKYGIIKNSRSEAVQYISTVANALKKKGLLQSLKNRGHDVYVLTTDSRKTVITIHSTNDAVYRLRYFIDSNYQKTFSADNVNQLINLVHSRLRIDRDETSQMDDIVGVWTQSDDDIDEKYTLSVNVDGEQLKYLDILASIETNKNPFIKPDLEESRKESGAKLKHVKTPPLHCLSCYLWVCFLGPLGIIIATILTATYTNKIIKLYGKNWLIAKHIGDTTFWRVIGAIIGFISAMITPLTNLVLREATNTSNEPSTLFVNPFAIIALFIMIIVGMVVNNIAKSSDETTD